MNRAPHTLGAWAVALLLGGGCAAVPHAYLTPRVGPLDVDGDVAISSSSGTASTSADALGLDEDTIVFNPRIDASWGGLDLMLSGYRGRFSGSGRTEGQFDLGGVVIAAGEDVDSRLDLGQASLLATWDLVPGNLIDLGIGLGASAFDVDARVRSQSSGDEVETDEVFVVPLLAARAAVTLGDFQLGLHWSGIVVDVGDVDARFHDFDLMARWCFLDTGSIVGALVAGYRLMLVDAEYDDGGSRVDVDLDFHGPYFGLTLGL
jgi:hypothetical protein